MGRASKPQQQSGGSGGEAGGRGGRERPTTTSMPLEPSETPSTVKPPLAISCFVITSPMHCMGGARGRGCGVEAPARGRAARVHLVARTFVLPDSRSKESAETEANMASATIARDMMQMFVRRAARAARSVETRVDEGDSWCSDAWKSSFFEGSDSEKVGG